MHEQLLKLAALGRQPHTVIQVPASAATQHPGAEGPLRIMKYRDSSPIWYTDSWNESGRLPEDKDEVLQAMMSFNLIRASAISPDRSLEFTVAVRVQNYESAHVG